MLDYVGFDQIYDAWKIPAYHVVSYSTVRCIPDNVP